MPHALTTLHITEASKKLHNKEISAVELISAHLQAIEAKNGALNAYTQVFKEHALEKAHEADANIASGNATPITGIPIAVKEIFTTKGFVSDCASKILAGFKPHYESTVTEKLFAAGAIMLGKTNMDEFAMGSANTTSCHGNVINPWQRSDGKPLTPGGSSGGSAAAVASNIAMAALGTDTGGSIRQPASFTGTVGLKPTYGRCSRFGMIAFASSLDHAGLFTRSVEDNAMLLQVMAGHDMRDSTSIQQPVPNYVQNIKKDIKGLRVGIPKEYLIDGLSPEIKAMWEQGAKWLQEQGAEIIDISLPHTKYALPVYYIIAPAEASSNLARYDGVRYGIRAPGEHTSINDMYKKTRSAGFGDEVKRRIMIGTYVLSSGHFDDYYYKALKIKQLLINDFRSAFAQVDVILTPSTPSEPFAIGENADDPVKMYLNDVFTVTANLVGAPAISVPAKLSANNLPLGLQLISPHFTEDKLLNVAYKLEEAANFPYLLT